MSGRENRIRDDEGRNREKDRSKECKGPLGHDYDVDSTIDLQAGISHLDAMSSTRKSCEHTRCDVAR
jgi:hypothetical protein